VTSETLVSQDSKASALMPSDRRAIFEKNVAALAPAARSALGTASDRQPLATPWTDASGTVITPDGRSVRLHSARHPVEEAEALVEPALRNRPPLLIVLGIGFGHVLDAVERQSPDTRVLALEPAISVTRSMLECRDWRDWLQSGRLTMLVGPEYAGTSDAWKLIDARAEPPAIVVAPAFQRFWPSEVARANKVAARIVAGAQANEEARRRFAGRYLLNTLANLPTIVDEADAASLFDAFARVPALVVAAGPSLDATLPAVRELADRAMIVAVDTAVRPLLAAGVRPHVAVAVDPSEANARHLADLPDASEIWFVGEGSIDPAVFPQFSGRTFTFKVSAHEPWPWLAAHGIERGTLRAWGSVLTTAYDLAVRAGCDPVVFAGADLAYSRGLQYCRNTVYEPQWQHWTTDAERAAALVPWLAARHTLEIGDVNGEPVITTPNFVQFRDWLVARAGEAGRVTLNGTGGGILHGPGVKMLDLAKWVELPSAGPLDIRERLRAAWQRGRTERPAVRDRLTQIIASRELNHLPMSTWLEFTRQTVSAGDIEQRLRQISA
jgi:hypothetical protein